MPNSLAHVALSVRDYDEAMAWFTEKLGFTLVANEHQPEQDKRWVLVAPPVGRAVPPAPARSFSLAPRPPVPREFCAWVG